MLRLGVLGGKYMTDCREEFPSRWFRGAKLAQDRSNPSLNYFGVSARQPSRSGAEKRLDTSSRLRGGFPLYCRDYMGRRLLNEDARQIKRWQAIRRHVRQVQRKLRAT